jgi:hypothetical protein
VAQDPCRSGGGGIGGDLSSKDKGGKNKEGCKIECWVRPLSETSSDLIKISLLWRKIESPTPQHPTAADMRVVVIELGTCEEDFVSESNLLRLEAWFPP